MPTSSEQAPAQTMPLPAVESPHPRTAEFQLYATLVAQIQADEEAGLAGLYKLFSRGIKYYLCRRVGPQDVEDRLHETLLAVTTAVRRGELREPERLMGFVHTVVRRQVAVYIRDAIAERNRFVPEMPPGPLEHQIADNKENPEQQAMRQDTVRVMKRALERLVPRDRELLVRYYLLEQKEPQICEEMALTANQFRLGKSRAKVRFGKIGRQELETPLRFRMKLQSILSS